MYETACGTVSQVENVDKNNHHALLQTSTDPRTAAQTLTELAKEKNYLIRINVAAHPNTSAEVLRLLANDKDYTVRKQVAKHPATSGDVLHFMAVDASNVAKPVLDPTDNYRWSKLPSDNLEAIKDVLEIIHEWRSEDRADIRLSVAVHTGTLAETLEFLAMDSDESVRRAVASNPNTPLEVALLLDPPPTRD